MDTLVVLVAGLDLLPPGYRVIGTKNVVYACGHRGILIKVQIPRQGSRDIVDALKRWGAEGW